MTCLVKGYLFALGGRHLIYALFGIEKFAEHGADNVAAANLTFALEACIYARLI